MSQASRVIPTIAATVVAFASLVACGGGAGTPKDTVAQVGHYAITKTSLNHWMSTIIGGDFYEISGKIAPKGLVAEPPDYAVCVADLETFRSGGAKPTAVALMSKCEQLYQALKEQALSYLITADVSIGQDAEQGLTVSDGEVEQAFKRLQAEQFPKEGELQRYLAERHWSLPDELFLVKRDLLSSKLRSKLEQKFSKTGGQRALISYVQEANKLWTAKTSCRPAYVAVGCKQYGATQAAAALKAPSPAILIEEIAGRKS